MPLDWAEGGTLSCPPYLTAMTAGYIIPVPHDTRLQVSETGEFWQYGKANIFEGHFAQQFAGRPSASVVPQFLITPGSS